MASHQNHDTDVLSGPLETSSGTTVPRTNNEKSHVAERDHQEDAASYETINYPKPWKFEKWFVGGYSQRRMLKLKNPKRMYTAINLFAGMLRGIPDLLVVTWYLGLMSNIRSHRRHRYHVLRVRSGSHVTGQLESRLSDTDGNQPSYWYRWNSSGYPTVMLISLPRQLEERCRGRRHCIRVLHWYINWSSWRRFPCRPLRTN